MMSLSPRRAIGLALASLVLSAGAANTQAALMTVSNTAPIVNGADIAQLVGGTDLGGDEGHVWSNRPIQGQTFTTLSSPGGYSLSAITFGTHSANFGNATSPDWTVRVGTVSGNVFTPVYSENATGVNIATNQFGTWSFANPVKLNPNTVYAIDVDPTGGGFVFANSNNPASYTGGTAYSSGSNGNPNNANMITRNGDRVFHANLETILTGKLSINFAGGRNGNFGPHNVAGTAGAIPLANWNNLAGSAFNVPDVFNAPLVDSAGSTTSATFSMDFGNTWDTGGPAATDNDRMMRSYIDNAAGTSLSLTGLDPAFTRHGYSIVVYYDTDSTGVFSIGATDSNGKSDVGFAYETSGNFAGTFIESFATTEAAAVALFNQGQTSNFLTLTGFTGANFSLQLINGNSPGDDRARISGIQVIANVIPEPTTAVFGLMALAGLGLRRRRVA